jgi:hypothetical protein
VSGAVAAGRAGHAAIKAASQARRKLSIPWAQERSRASARRGCGKIHQCRRRPSVHAGGLPHSLSARDLRRVLSWHCDDLQESSGRLCFDGHLGVFRPDALAPCKAVAGFTCSRWLTHGSRCREPMGQCQNDVG